jgi:hypothetical protein
MNCKKEIKRIVNGKELEDVEFFLNGKSIAYATMQDDQDYYSVDICAVDKNGEKITNGFVCPCCDLIENISAAFPEWEKQYMDEDEEEHLRERVEQFPWKPDMKGNYIYGDYVLTKVNNAFNDKSSYWISKKGCTRAYYCFTSLNADNLRENMKETSGWISYFKQMNKE